MTRRSSRSFERGSALAADAAHYKKRVEFLEKYLKALSNYLRVLADWE